MSLPWFYAVDHLPSGAAGKPMILGDGALTSGGENPSNDTTLGRVVLQSAGAMTKSVAASPRMTIGARVRLSNVSTNLEFLRFSNANGVLLNLFRNGGVIEVRRGATVLAATTVILDTSWQYVEFSALFHATAGEFELRSNGQVIVATAGVNTANVAVSMGATAVEYRGSSTPVSNWTDLYIRDDDTFHGPIKLTRLTLESDIEANWTRNAGTSNFGRLIETGSDGNTTYIESNILANADEYGVENLPQGVNSIIAVVPFAVSTAPNGGAPQIDLRTRVGAGGPLSASDPATVGVSTYQTQTRPQALAPDGSNWSIAKVNDLQLRIEAA